MDGLLFKRESNLSHCTLLEVLINYEYKDIMYLDQL